MARRSRDLGGETTSNACAVIQIDVKDVANLHVAAVLDPDTKNARLQAWNEHFNWNDMLPILRRLYPQHKFIDDVPPETVTHLQVRADFSEPLALLRKWEGQDGFISFEQSVAENSKPYLA